MKNFNYYKEQIAESYGFSDWGDLLCADRVGHTTEPLDYYIDEAAELYATEVAKAQRESCYESLTIEHTFTKQKVLSTPLVTDKPG